MLWLDGRISDDTRAPFDFADRGLLLADGLFETILVIGGTPFLLDAHLERLARGAESIGMPCDRDVVLSAVRDLAGAQAEPAVVRVTVTRGAGPRGLRPPAAANPTVFATSAPWSPALAFKPQTLAVSAIRRNASSPLSRLKSLSYLDNVLALEDATRGGADDALLLSTNGNVACTSAANLFVVQGDRLSTPPLSDGVLAGTMRACVLALAPDVGLNAEKKSLSLDDVRKADAAFSTNSVRLVSPIAAIDGESVGTASGERLVALLMEGLRARVRDACGVDLFSPLSL
jgi:branched-chain amino acid aminotransferase